MTLGFTTLIDHRSMEHHYTESLGHDDIKFYPPTVTSWWPRVVWGQVMMTLALSLGHDDIKLIEPTCTEPYYTRTVLTIAESRHTELLRADRPPKCTEVRCIPHQLNLVLELYYTRSAWHVAECRCTQVRCIPHPYPLVIKPCGTEHYYTRWVWHVEVFRCTKVRCTPPQLHLVLQSSTTPGQFDMWQNADVPRSGVLPTPGYQT